MVITNQIRFKILERDNFACRYCGAKAPEVRLEIDHIKPQSKNGPDDIENLITACERCNSGKSDLELVQMFAVPKIDVGRYEDPTNYKAYKQKQMRMAEETWIELCSRRRAAGKSWNMFIRELLGI